MRLFFILLITFLIFSCRALQPANFTPLTTEVNAELEHNESIIEIIKPYKKGLEDKMNRVIGVFEHDMKKAQPESSLGNFMCDASEEYMNNLYGSEIVDFTFMNSGGIRVLNIPKGEITVGNMYELMPFENELVILKMPGKIVKELFQYLIVEKGGEPVSNSIKIVAKEADLKSITINNEPLLESKIYRVLTTDYLATSAGLKMIEGLEMEKTNQKLRDVLIAYCEWKNDNNESISAPITGRFKL